MVLFNIIRIMYYLFPSIINYIHHVVKKGKIVLCEIELKINYILNYQTRFSKYVLRCCIQLYK